MGAFVDHDGYPLPGSDQGAAMAGAAGDPGLGGIQPRAS